LEDLRAKGVAESVHAAKNVELESLVKSLAQKIAALEATYVYLKLEKEGVTAGYRRLSEKHKTLVERTERGITELVEAHMMELAKVHGEFGPRNTELY
jgi:hypothetical protein